MDAKLLPTLLKSVNNLTNLESLMNLLIFWILHLVLINWSLVYHQKKKKGWLIYRFVFVANTIFAILYVHSFIFSQREKMLCIPFIDWYISQGVFEVNDTYYKPIFFFLITLLSSKIFLLTYCHCFCSKLFNLSRNFVTMRFWI